MKKAANLFFIGLCLCQSSFSQLQRMDQEGVMEASFLRKLDRKAKYGAFNIDKEISFGTATGITGEPVVTANENGSMELVAIENKAVVGYTMASNQFARLSDYYLEMFYNTEFVRVNYKPQRVSLNDESIFLDDNYGEFYGFRAAETGQRCRLRYNYKFNDAKYMTRVFFHEAFPVKHFSIRFKIPDWLTLEITEKNCEGYKFVKFTKKEKGYTIYSYAADNLSGIKPEPNSQARPYFLPHLLINVRAYSVNNKQYNGFQGPGDMYAWYNFLYKKTGNQPEAVKALVQQLTKGKVTDEEKIKALYYWVQDNIRYIAFEEGYAGFIPQPVQEVFKNKYGDCKGMANLLTCMLKQAGYDAHFAWIGTRDIPYDRTEVQSMCVDNHAICVLYHKGQTYFLDGTEKFAPLGKNAYRIQGKKVMVEKGESYAIETVPEAQAGENRQFTKADLVLKDNKITGHVKVSFEGEAAHFFHYTYNNLSASRRKDFINSLVQLNTKGAEISNVTTSDFKNRDIRIVVEGDIDLSEQVTAIENRYYTGIDFFPGMITRFIPEEKRKCPIDMNTIYVSVDEVTLQLPAGAKPISLPGNFKSAFLQNEVEASYVVKDNKIVLQKTLRINSPVINRGDFADWKDFLNKIRTFNKSNLSVEL